MVSKLIIVKPFFFFFGDVTVHCENVKVWMWLLRACKIMCKIDTVPVLVLDYLCLALETDTSNEEIWKMSLKEQTRCGYKFRKGMMQKSDGGRRKVKDFQKQS